MATFKDAKNREWKLRLYRSDPPELRERGFNMSALSAGDASVMEEFAKDEVFDAVFKYLCRDQIKALGITEQEFLSGFDSDVSDKATSALLVEYALFSRRLPEKAREAIEEKMREMKDKQIDSAIDTIRNSGSSKNATNSAPSSDSSPNAPPSEAS